jgi:outer membrane lipoprotein-sorting protein
MKYSVFFYLIFMTSFANAQTDLSAPQIVEKAQEAIKVKGVQGVSILTIIDEKGRERVRKIAQVTKNYEADKTEKRLIRFMEPADIKGTGLLTYDYENTEDDIWLYLPALRKTRRIVSSEKAKNFMGSEFTYADMIPPSVNDFTFTMLKDEKVNEIDCYQIEWIPVNEDIADENGFSRRITFVGKEDYMIRKSLYFDIDNELHKELHVFSIKELDPVNHRYRAVKMEMINHLNGRRSILENTQLEFNPDIKDEYFTLRYLERE